MDVLKNGEIWLHGTVGNGFFMEGFTASDVADALAQIGRRKPVTVHVNSGGGIASEGAAIHAVLSAHSGPKKVIIEGVAASAASLLAMAGDEVLMKKGSIMMIHDPSGFTAGTSKDHSKTIEGLEALANSMAEIYADKAGKTVEDARADMKEEIWLTPDAAKKAGYIDALDAGKARPIAAFDYRLYSHAPERFVALAKHNGWEGSTDAELAAGAADLGEEPDMAENTKGGTANNSVATDSPEFKAAVAGAVATALKEADDKKKADEAAAEAAKKANGGTETTEQMTARIRGEEQKRTADITAACTLAGQAAKAATFIAENKTLSEVIAALQTERANEKGGTGTGTGTKTGATAELNNHRSVGGQTGTGGTNRSEPDDTKAAWARQTDRINKRNGHRATA